MTIIINPQSLNVCVYECFSQVKRLAAQVNLSLSRKVIFKTFKQEKKKEKMEPEFGMRGR